MAAHFDLNSRIPHRPPWLLVDGIVEVAGARVVTQKRITANDPLVTEDGLAETLLVEALAQTAACLNGETRGHHQGYLVALSGFSFTRRPLAGETMTCTAERTAMLGSLHRFSGTITVGDELLCRGQLTFALVEEAA